MEAFPKKLPGIVQWEKDNGIAYFINDQFLFAGTDSFSAVPGLD